MGRNLVTSFVSYYAFTYLLLASTVVLGGRHINHDVPELLVSDGFSEDESFLHLKEIDSASSDEELHCVQMYGFLPCSSNLPGHIFLILIYEYLLYQGESYAGGDGRIFRLFGKNFFGASFYQLLDSLPESLILLVSGLLSSNEETQEYAVTGVGLLAGSSILLLTVLWGTCLIFGSQKFYVKPDSRGKENKHGFQLLTGSGVHTDSETSHHAKIMLFSVIPFIIILTPWAFGEPYSSKDYNVIVLSSLFIAVLCLFFYFYYQFVDNEIRVRIMDYAELERKIEMHVSFYDVQSLMRKRDKHLMDWQIEMENNKSDTQTKDDFNDRLDMTRFLMDDPYTDKSKTELNEVAQILLKDKIKFMRLISDMIDHMMGGKLDEAVAINNFFDLIDVDKSLSITTSELKDYIISQYGDGLKHDTVDALVDLIMQRLDVNENGTIEREEFTSRIARWKKEIKPYIKVLSDDDDKKEYHNAEVKARKDGMFKAIALLILGIVMLTILAEPLIQSVRIFSESVEIAPFYISFVLVPLATNARTAIAAIRAARQKRHHIASLTFSEIYHKVFMNNTLGFSVLVSVIYFRGLTWHFSVEVLVLVIVCFTMGLLASFRSKFPNWTLFVAFPLYPLSLVLVYYVDDTFKFT